MYWGFCRDESPSGPRFVREDTAVLVRYACGVGGVAGTHRTAHQTLLFLRISALILLAHDSCQPAGRALPCLAARAPAVQPAMQLSDQTNETARCLTLGCAGVGRGSYIAGVPGASSSVCVALEQPGRTSWRIGLCKIR